MGLDVTAYSKIKKLDSFEADEYGEPFGVDYFQLWVNTDFQDHGKGLSDGFYTYENEHGFKAGSYSGYGNWRNQLAILAGFKDSSHAWAKEEEKYPFHELINFSDCEGVINSDICKKLLSDFLQFEEKAKEDENFYYRYQQWIIGLKLASDDGCFTFH